MLAQMHDTLIIRDAGGALRPWLAVSIRARLLAGGDRRQDFSSRDSNLVP